MEYLNQFHKETTEKSLKAIAEMKKTPINYEEELERHNQIHIRAAKLEEEYLKERRQSKIENPTKDLPLHNLTKQEISKLTAEEAGNYFIRQAVENLNNPANHGKTR